MSKIKIFLASSKELAEERVKFVTEINSKNKVWYQKDLFLHLDMWEDLTGRMSQTRSQDEYNEAVKKSDLFVLVVFTKVGIFSAEEFTAAFGQFKETNKPFIYIYFKENQNAEDPSVTIFKQLLKELGHFSCYFSDFNDLWNKFNKELEGLEDNNFIKRPLIVVSGNQNLVITQVNDNRITINYNGAVQEIKNELTALKEFLLQNQIQTIQATDKTYPIHDLNETTFGLLTGRKPFNELLTKRILTALQDFSPDAKNLLDSVRDFRVPWETQKNPGNSAREIIKRSFDGFIGIQLRRLFAIGIDPFSREKHRNYLEMCLITCKRTLQLLCYILISELWNKKIENPDQYQFNAAQKQMLRKFFEIVFEMNIDDYFQLFLKLYAIFDEYQIEFPLSELGELRNHVLPNSSFAHAINTLQTLSEKFDNNTDTQLDCFEAEIQITEMLVTLVFLAKYKMNSIKDLDHVHVRNKSPFYIHHYAKIKEVTESNINAERVNCTDDTVNTDSILLFKERYQESISLFPFILDYNALTFELGTKLCFYSYFTSDDESLNYHFFDDNSEQNIVDGIEEPINMNDIMKDKEGRKKYKFHIACEQFRSAKKALLGSPE